MEIVFVSEFRKKKYNRNFTNDMRHYLFSHTQCSQADSPLFQCVFISYWRIFFYGKSGEQFLILFMFALLGWDSFGDYFLLVNGKIYYGFSRIFFFMEKWQKSQILLLFPFQIYSIMTAAILFYALDFPFYHFIRNLDCKCVPLKNAPDARYIGINVHSSHFVKYFW